MSARILIIILGSAAVTYLPRALPFLMPFPERIPPFIGRFLRVMPVAALGGLIFPAVLLSFPEAPLAGLAGVSAAALIALWWGGMILPVLSSVGAALLVLSLV